MPDRSSGIKIRAIPNPDDRKWHRLTVIQWKNAWLSPMAAQWLETDYDGLGRLALLWDSVNKEPDSIKAAFAMKEIRLQEARFGLTPLDRSRLQWEVSRAEEAERKKPAEREKLKKTGTDPRRILMAVK